MEPANQQAFHRSVPLRVQPVRAQQAPCLQLALMALKMVRNTWCVFLQQWAVAQQSNTVMMLCQNLATNPSTWTMGNQTGMWNQLLCALQKVSAALASLVKSSLVPIPRVGSLTAPQIHTATQMSMDLAQ
jgi:hypothetical protein